MQASHSNAGSPEKLAPDTAATVKGEGKPPMTPREDFLQRKEQALRLKAVYKAYACFGSAGPLVFKSANFVKLIREAGLMSPDFNIYPPNRIDFVYTYAWCACASPRPPFPRERTQRTHASPPWPPARPL